MISIPLDFNVAPKIITFVDIPPTFKKGNLC